MLLTSEQEVLGRANCLLFFHYNLRDWTASRQGQGPIQPPAQWVPGAPSLGESDHCVKLATHFYLVPRSGMVELYLQGQFNPYIYKMSVGTSTDRIEDTAKQILGE
jgi:hypothetical protein